MVFRKTGVYTTGGKPAGAQNVTRDSVRGAGTPSTGTGAPSVGEKKVIKDGREYTYLNGRLVGVSQGRTTQAARRDAAQKNQAARDVEAWKQEQANAYPTGTADGSGGDGTSRAVQAATDALLASIRGGGYGQQYQPGIEALQGLLDADRASLQSGAYMAPVTALQGQLGTIYDQSKGNIGTANTALMDWLSKNMTNPFANVQAQTGVVDPALAGLLEQQGVSAEPLQAEVAAAREAAQVGGGQFQNLLDVMSGLQAAGLQSRQSEQGLANLFAQQALEANRAGYGQQLLGRGEELRQGLEDRIRGSITDIAGLQGQKASAKETLQGQLIDLIAKGGNVSKDVMKQVFGSDVTDSAKDKASSVKKQASQYDTFKQAVKAMHPNFKGSTAQAKKKFPKLAAAFKK